MPAHPCFDPDARHSHGRIHLPVAPRCNVQCNFCNRRFDCVNESRPGVSSAVLTPGQALWYCERMLAEDPSISVVGIAGPGDPFANPTETMQTLRMVAARFPELALCVASNGLAIAPHAAALRDCGVGHVTITVNAVEPDLAGKIYRWIRDGETVLRGENAGRRICSRQAAAISMLKRLGMTVKVNCIVMPGVNDEHVETVARATADLGADLFNLMPLMPVAGTAFAHLSEPDAAMLRALRKRLAGILPQMPHCSRCRADAVGKIGCNNPPTAIALMEEATTMDERPHVAVCSMEGMLVNQHLGHADHILIYAEQEDHFSLVEVREAPSPGSGDARWQKLAAGLGDCRALLASAIGPTPQGVLEAAGVSVHSTEGLIADALELVFGGREEDLQRVVCASTGSCGGSCSAGAGNACA